MTGFCPYKKGSLRESECHHDGYCSECPHNTKDDTISRQAAIRAYCENQCGKGMIRGECGCDDCGTIFDDIPSAQPERERTMEEFMFGQDMGNPEDGSL